MKRDAGKGGGWIGVDLDGTLAEYRPGSFALNLIGRPIKPMIKRVMRWLEQGRDVRIFTARVSNPETPEWVRELIGEWALAQFGKKLPITCTKDFDMDELWDDRCVQVETNTGKVMCKSTRGLR